MWMTKFVSPDPPMCHGTLVSTEFIPGSHRSGRHPAPGDYDANGVPSYNGQQVFKACGKAGSAVLWNDQIWHQGGPNTSDGRIRWVIQAPYAKRYIAQRFYPFINYRMPAEILAANVSSVFTPLGPMVDFFQGLDRRNNCW
jgi:ectoine hydroxylase-related dioxygenase (phytanoyl-CoA dioxygenase family)